MYRRDAKIISLFAAESPENTFLVGRFVYMTINQYFERLPKHIQTAGTLLPGKVHHLSRNAKIGIQSWWDHRHAIYDVVHSDRTEAEKISFLTTLHGLGIIKSAFVIQLTSYGSTVGCLDRHHLHAIGLNRHTFTRLPRLALQRATRILDYVALCALQGGGEALWNTWCTLLSKKRPKSFPTPDAVSRLHVDLILPN